jgi:hypothetical protein
MFIAALAGEVSSLTLLCRVIALTLFYAALCWLPLRGTAAAVRVMHRRKRRRREARRQAEPTPQRTQADDIWIIQ